MKKQVLFAVLSLLLAAVLIAALVRVFSVSQDGLLVVCQQISPTTAALLLFALLLYSLIIALRWRLVMYWGGIKGLNFGFCYWYTLVGFLAAMVLPRQLSFVVVKSGSMKFLGEKTAVQSAATVAYDTAVTLYICGLLVIPALLFLGGFAQGWLLWGIMAGVCMLGLAGALCGVRMVHWIGGLDVDRLPAGRGLAARLTKCARDVQNTQLVQPRTIVLIYTLALIQAFINLLPAYVCTHLAHLDADYQTIFFAWPIIFFFALFGVTPAGLGISEWTWVAYLTFAGFEAQQAAEFSLICRISIWIGQLTLFFGFAILRGAFHIWRCRQKAKPGTP